MVRKMQRVVASSAALALVLGLAACGDDDDDEGAQTDEEVTADPAAFCDALVEFNGLVLQSEVDEESSEEDVVAAGEQLVPVWERVVENAPEGLADDADALADSSLRPLLEGDPAGFNSDETFEQYTQVLAQGVGECGFETIAVTGVDYAYEGVPTTISAGTVSFDFTNASQAEEHEMLIIKKADGVTQTFQEIADLPEEESESLIEFKGAAFAPPGGQSGTLAELDPGSYAMICFIPVGGGEEGPPHFTQGMLTEFTVE